MTVTHTRKPLGDSPDVPGYDILILSDLLYFDRSHEQLVRSIELLLSRKKTSRAYVAAGMYTPEAVCSQFFKLASSEGLGYEEQTHITQVEEEKRWRGEMEVVGISSESLAARKADVRWWIVWWREE